MKILASFAIWVLAVLALTGESGKRHVIRSIVRNGNEIRLKHEWPIEGHPNGGWQEIYFAPTLTSAWSLVSRSYLDWYDEAGETAVTVGAAGRESGFFKIVGLPDEPDPWETDSDDDGLLDGYELSIGTDPNVADTDGDGLSDGEENAYGSDPCKADTDDDGADDAIEWMLGLDPTNRDTDEDGLTDGFELEIGTDPKSADSDCDGIPDGWEYENGLDPMRWEDFEEDSDGDGLTNYEEWTMGTDPQVPNLEGDSDGDGLTDEEEEFYMSDPMNPDTDADGLSDYEEVQRGTNPCNRDSDGDGIPDAEEIRLGLNPISPDTDNDAMTDDLELAYGLDPKKHADAEEDPDGDGLKNVDELRYGTDPHKADTDGDGATDGWEIDNGFNPLDPSDGKEDSDGDGLTNAEECRYGTDPREADADRDGLPDGLEIELGSSPTDAHSLSATYDDRVMYHSGGMDPLGSPEGSPYTYWQHKFYSGSALGVVCLPVPTATSAVLRVSVSGSGFGEVEVGDRSIALMGSGATTNHNELLVSLPRGRRLGFYQSVPSTLQVSYDSNDFAVGQKPYDPSPSGWIAFPTTRATEPCIHDLNTKTKGVSLDPGMPLQGLVCTWQATDEIDVDQEGSLSALVTARFPIKETRSLSHTLSHPQALFGAKTYVQTARFCPCGEEDEATEEGGEWERPEEETETRICWCLGEYCMVPNCACPCHERQVEPEDEEELFADGCPVHRMPPEACAELHRESYSNALALAERSGVVKLPGDRGGLLVRLTVPEGEGKCCDCPEHDGKRVTLAAKSEQVRVTDETGGEFTETTEDSTVEIVGVLPSEEIGDAKVAFCRGGKLSPRLALTVLGLGIDVEDMPMDPQAVEREVTLVTDVALSQGDIHLSLTSEYGHFQLWYERYEGLRMLLLDSKTQPTFETDIRWWRKMLVHCTSGRESSLVLVKKEPGEAKIEFGFAVADGHTSVRDCVTKTVSCRQPYLVFDYDRNGEIDGSDVRLAKAEQVFSFWTNDDGDAGDAVDEGDYLSDLPGSGKNGSDDKVNGLRDLLDFTPVAIDLSEAFPAEGDGIPRERVKWRLKSDCVRAVWTGLSLKDAGSFRSETKTADFGEGLGEAPETATSVSLVGGVDLPTTLVNRLLSEEDDAVFLIEGVRPGADLVLEGWYDDGLENRKVFETHAALNVTGVEKMYRHISIRAAAADPDCTVTIPDDPQNLPAGAASAGDVFFVHGFNVEPAAARVWFAEVFKRLWQSGSNARFNGIEWAGDYHALSDTFNAVHYQRDVYHALMSSAALKRVVEAIPSTRKILLAHSLGNMMASEALKNGLRVDTYVMLNAAVPSEAYVRTKHNESEEIRRKYVPDDWRDYPERSWAANWYTWFPDDDRGQLGWTGRYENLGAGETLAYYTSEDEVFEEDESAPSLLTNVFHWPTLSLTWPFVDLSGVITLDSFAWQKSEVCKGVEPIAGSFSGGWGFHLWSESVPGTEGAMMKRYSSAGAAQMVADGSIVENPVFDRGQRAMFNPTITQSDKCHVLAYNVPAVSSAAGYDDIGKKGGDVCNLLNGGRGNPKWRHSGLKTLAYWHVYRLYDAIAGETEVRR